MINDEQLLPPKMLPQPLPQLLLPPQNKRIRIRKRQLLPPPNTFEPQFETLHIILCLHKNLFYSTYYVARLVSVTDNLTNIRYNSKIILGLNWKRSV